MKDYTREDFAKASEKEIRQILANSYSLRELVNSATAEEALSIIDAATAEEINFVIEAIIAFTEVVPFPRNLGKAYGMKCLCSISGEKGHGQLSDLAKYLEIERKSFGRACGFFESIMVLALKAIIDKRDKKGD